LEISGFNYQQCDRLELLWAAVSRMTELTQLVKGFLIELSNNKLKKISEVLQNKKGKAKKMAQPLLS
jgi:hypothetical protein